MKLRILCALIALLCTTKSFSQFIIKGKISETETGSPVAGATISVSGKSLKSKADANGLFELKSEQAIKEIKVSHIGYTTQIVKIGANDKYIEVLLKHGDDTNLDMVNVTSKYYKKYNIKAISSSLRLQSPLINVSQNIQEISSDVIADQGAFNVNEGVTRNVSGVIRQEVSNNLGPNIFMRGGQISTLKNGVDLTPIYRGPIADDAAVIDRVEFIKGPSGFMNNVGDPAGSFNVITKQPTGSTHYSADLMLGSWDLYRAAADLDGVLDKKGKLQYRLNVMGMSSNSYVQDDFSKRFLVAPVLKYVIDDKTTVSLEYTFQKLSYGLLSPIVMTPKGFGTLPNDFTISENSLKPYNVTDHSGAVTFTHAFNKNWSLTAKGAFLRNENEGIYMWVTGVNKANPDILLRNPKYDLNRSMVFSQQAFVNGKVTTGSVEHQILAGVDFNQKKFIADSYVSYDTYTGGNGASQLTYYPLDINNPVYGAQVPGYETPGGIHNGNTDQKINYYSIYALDELAFFAKKLRLTLGARFTSVNTYNDVSNVVSSSADKKITPRIGLSYSLTPDLSFYGLYDQTLVPQTGITSSGSSIKPQTGVDYEVGIKKNWFNSSWNTTLAVYKIKRTNIVSGDPDNPIYKVQVGETGSKGIELDVVGEIVKRLNVVINYAYNDSKVDYDVNAALIGMRTPMYVKHVQNTWLNYEFSDRVIKGLSLSLGYQYQGGRGERFVTATPQKIPDYFRVDSGVGYKYKKVKVNLIVNNILDKHLIATPWYRSGLYYWVSQPPVNARLSLGYTF